jgi:hypothetical protein
LTETSGTGTQLAEGAALPKHLRSTLINQGFAQISSFTITIVNDLNTITPVSSYCSHTSFLLYLMAGISPKAEEQIPEIQNLQLKPQ